MKCSMTVVYEIFDEAVEIMLPNQLRLFYSTYLTGEQPATALDIWEKYKKHFCEGFHDNNEYRALQHISSILEAENFTCTDFNLPEPDVDLQFVETMDQCKRRLDNKLKQGVEMKANCNTDQLLILDQLLSSVVTYSDDKIFFIDGPGGTGKTYLYICLNAFFASK